MPAITKESATVRISGRQRLIKHFPLFAVVCLCLGTGFAWSEEVTGLAPIPQQQAIASSAGDGLPVIVVSSPKTSTIAPLPNASSKPATPALKAAAPQQFVPLMPLAPVAGMPSVTETRTQQIDPQASASIALLSDTPVPTHPEPTKILPGSSPLPASTLAPKTMSMNSSRIQSVVSNVESTRETRPKRISLRQRLFGWLHRNQPVPADATASRTQPAQPNSRATATTTATLPQQETPSNSARQTNPHHHSHAGIASTAPVAYDMQSVSVTSYSSRAQDDSNRWVTLQILTPDVQQVETLARTVRTYNRSWSDDYVRQMAELIVELSGRHAVDYRLIASIIAVESSFRMNAVSPTGAMGLGQLLPSTARWLQVSNPFDPVDNATAVSRYLSYLQSEFPQEWDKAVASYFVGQGTVKRSGITPSAQAYVQRVANVYRQLEPVIQ